MTSIRCSACPASKDGVCSKDIVELSKHDAHCNVMAEILLRKHEAMLRRVREAEKKGQTVISIHRIHDAEKDDEED